jgi:hypothetical protein
VTFLPGQSGNPAGRPRGSRNKKTLILEALMRKLIGTGETLDDAALRLCFERMLAPPTRKLIAATCRPRTLRRSSPTGSLGTSQQTRSGRAKARRVARKRNKHLVRGGNNGRPQPAGRRRVALRCSKKGGRACKYQRKYKRGGLTAVGEVTAGKGRNPL